MSPMDDHVDKGDYEEFKKNVIEFLGILVQAFDKNTNVTRTSQASIDNLTETIEDLAKLHHIDSERSFKLLTEIKNRLAGNTDDD
jgi:hypothetical protein